MLEDGIIQKLDMLLVCNLFQRTMYIIRTSETNTPVNTSAHCLTRQPIIPCAIRFIVVNLCVWEKTYKLGTSPHLIHYYIAVWVFSTSESTWYN